MLLRSFRFTTFMDLEEQLSKATLLAIENDRKIETARNFGIKGKEAIAEGKIKVARIYLKRAKVLDPSNDEYARLLVETDIGKEDDSEIITGIIPVLLKKDSDAKELLAECNFRLIRLAYDNGYISSEDVPYFIRRMEDTISISPKTEYHTLLKELSDIV